MIDNTGWLASPEEIKQEWRKWAKGPGLKTTADAFVAGYHAAQEHGLSKLRQEIRALREAVEAKSREGA